MKGRTAVYELMPMSEDIRDLTLERSSSSKIKEQANAAGMKGMRDSAIRKVLLGITTLEEITRVLALEEQ